MGFMVIIQLKHYKRDYSYNITKDKRYKYNDLIERTMLYEANIVYKKIGRYIYKRRNIDRRRKRCLTFKS